MPSAPQCSDAPPDPAPAANCPADDVRVRLGDSGRRQTACREHGPGARVRPARRFSDRRSPLAAEHAPEPSHSTRPDPGRCGAAPGAAGRSPAGGTAYGTQDGGTTIRRGADAEEAVGAGEVQTAPHRCPRAEAEDPQGPHRPPTGSAAPADRSCPGSGPGGHGRSVPGLARCHEPGDHAALPQHVPVITPATPISMPAVPPASRPGLAG